jgi:hypothetical protein
VNAQGSLVFNGGFDTNASGWTLQNLSLGGGYEATKGNPPGDVALDATPSPPLEPTASQLIAGLIPGSTYLVSGDYRNIANRGGGSATDPSFGVAVDGVFFFQGFPQTNNSNWRTFSFFYDATSTSATLSLSAQINGTGVSYAVDNVGMFVPEPGAVSLGLVAGIGAVMFSRKRTASSCREGIRDRC